MNILTLGARVTADTSDFHGKMGQVKGEAESVKGSLSSISSATVGLGTMLGNFATTAISSVISGLGNMGAHAVEVVGKNERLEMSYQSLLAREIRNNSAVEKRIYLGTRMVTVGGQQAASTDKMTKGQKKYADALDDVTSAEARYKKITVDIAEAKKKKNESDQHFEARVGVMRAQAGQLESSMSELNATIDKFGPKTTATGEVMKKMVPIYRTEIQYTKTRQQAQEEAAKQAQALMKWTERLAIESPFNKDDIAQGFKSAMAYGMNSKEAKIATQAVVDFAAATGQESEAVGGLLFAMGQIHNSDKLMSQDLRQLMNRGVDVNAVLRQMGTSYSKVGKSSVDSRKFLELMIKTMQDDFGGAAKAQSGTISGLIASIEDLKDIATEDFFKPILMSAKPAIQGIVDALSDDEVKGALAAFGTAIGGVLSGPLNVVAGLFKGGSTMIKTFMTNLKETGPITAMREALKSVLPPSLAPTIDRVARGVQMMRYAFTQAKDPAKAFKIGMEDIFGKDFTASMQPIIDWAFKLPDAIKQAIDQVKTGDFAGAANTIIKAIFTGEFNWLSIVSGWIKKIAEGIKNGEYITTIGNNFASLVMGALNMVDTLVTSEQIRIPLLKFIGNMGSAAGSLLGAVANALSSWVDQLAGFPAEVTDDQAKSGLQKFIDKLASVIRNSGDLFIDITSAFVAGFLGSLLNWSPEDTEAARSTAAAFWKKFFNPDYKLTGKETAQLDQANAQLEEAGTGMFDWIGEELKGALDNLGSGMEKDAQPFIKFINGEIDAAKEFFGIKSPSSYTAENLGKPLAQGIGVGIEGEKATLTAKFTEVITSAVEGVGATAVKFPIAVTPTVTIGGGNQPTTSISTSQVLATMFPGQAFSYSESSGTAIASTINVDQPINLSVSMSFTGQVNPVSPSGIAGMMGLVASQNAQGFTNGYSLPAPITITVPVILETSVASAATAGGAGTAAGTLGSPAATLGKQVIYSITAAMTGKDMNDAVAGALNITIPAGIQSASTFLKITAAGAVGGIPYTMGAGVAWAINQGLTEGLKTIDTTLKDMELSFTNTTKSIKEGFAVEIAAVGETLKTTVATNFSTFTGGALAGLNGALSTTKGLLESILSLIGRVNASGVPSPSSYAPPGGSGNTGGRSDGPNFRDSTVLDNFNSGKRDSSTTVVHVNIGSRHAGTFVKEAVADQARYDASRYYN